MYKKWSHYAKHGDPSIFYRTTRHYGWHMAEMVPHFKKMQLIKCHLLMTSSDPEVRQIYEARSKREHSYKGSHPKFAASLGQAHVPASTNPVLRNAWKPCVELKQLVSEVKHKGMVKGAQADSCKLGIGAGLCRIKQIDTEAAQERAEVLLTFGETVEERRLNACIKKEYFSEWVKWGKMMRQERDWNKVIRSQEDDLFRFNLAATEDVLPTPSVLKCWKQLSNPKCSLCHEKNASLRHILCGCQVALAQGRQTWRHDSVLLAIYQTIREMRNRGKARFLVGKTEPQKLTKFVSASVKGHGSASEGSKFTTEFKEAPNALFETSDDWELQFDVCVAADGQTKNSPFPPHIIASKYRPDGVMWSNKLKTVVWIELTSPWEENMTNWHMRKHDKYNKLAIAIRAKGWTAIPLCVEVGARGYINHKWGAMRKVLGMRDWENKALRAHVTEVSQRCSYFIYLSKKNKEWVVRPLLNARSMATQ